VPSDKLVQIFNIPSGLKGYQISNL